MDFMRPHAMVTDRPTVRLIMFRDVALRPVFGRVVSLLQVRHLLP
jgi:hypothetical protein